MKEIQLTQNQVALVDDEDYEYLNQWKWCATKRKHTFYAITCINGKNILMHQLLADRWGFKNQVDHFDRNGCNNQLSNCRDTTQKQNIERSSLRSDNKSGRKGVYWDKARQKWHAQIRHNGKGLSLGRFDIFEDAVFAREQAEQEYFTHATT